MAVENKLASTVRIRYVEEIDDITGDPILKTKSLSNVKVDSAPTALLNVVNALMSLQMKDIYKVERHDVSSLKKD